MTSYRAEPDPCAEPFLTDLHRLISAVFGGNDRDKLVWKLERMPDVSVFVAQEGELVGFKIGYALAPQHYYSWLGGVHPDFRRRGIGLALMGRQHQWLRQRGFTAVETNAPHTNAAMIGLNHRAGFTVVGTYMKNDLQRVIMAKAL